MSLKPHDHRMWAVIGIYTGGELNAKDAVPLGSAVIHAVTNPLDQVPAAIHVYGGDFFATPRSEWDPETFEERPYDVRIPNELLKRRTRDFMEESLARSNDDLTGW